MRRVECKKPHVTTRSKSTLPLPITNGPSPPDGLPPKGLDFAHLTQLKLSLKHLFAMISCFGQETESFSQHFFI